jgi:hypothetical protein
MSKRPPGRPLIADVPSTARIELRVTPAQRIELRRVANENQTGVAGLLREAVNEFVADYHERQLFIRRKR